jgi:eukaryotic-like serine/threonine-protein kinase
MIGTTIGNYRVESALCEGGMSHVYLGRTIARSELLPESFVVVLKVMSDELADEETARKRFQKEAQILAKLRHRYITRFYEFIQRDISSVLVMEYVHGDPIDRVIAQRRGMSIADAIAVTQCLLEALVYAHGKGIVHRDIKPANLIRQPNGIVKVTDFGIAKIREASGAAQTVLTRSGFILGTPHYMSPEQIRDPREAGPSCDIYSAGVVLYEMLTGTLPFNSRSLPKLIDLIYRGEKQPVRSIRPEIEPELGDIVMKAIAREASDRFQSAREMFEALEEYAARPSLTGPAPERADRGTIPAPPVKPAARPAGWQLVSVKEGEKDRFDVAGENVMVGRDRACSIVLAHPAVSRRHARLTISGSGFALEDLHSANGTWVNDSRVEQTILKAGDVVRFGADPACSYVVRLRTAGD